MLLWLPLFLAAPMISAQVADVQFCALQVTVKSPQGELVSGVPVAARADGGGYQFNVRSDTLGVARICDVPVGSTIDVSVGDDHCSTIVHDVNPLWRTTRFITVTYQRCDSKEMQLGFCHILIRVRDTNNRPISGVTWSETDNPRLVQGSLTSDTLGRIFASVLWRVAPAGVLEKRGYAQQDLILKCDPKTSVGERTVTLGVR